MASIPFHKYHGAGNDFIVIDNIRDQFDSKLLNPPIIRWMCHRRFGVGADGLIQLVNSEDVDFEMLYCKADGKIAALCGNGSRCAIAFAVRSKLVNKRKVRFLASDGYHQGCYDPTTGDVTLDIKCVKQVTQIDENNYFLDTGSPHHVVLVENTKTADVQVIGHSIRNHDRYADIGGANVNFCQGEACRLLVRTYERGVENETYACGTGAVACAIVDEISKKSSGEDNGHLTSKVVRFRGGDLTVSFQRVGDRSFDNVQLKGPAKHVYTGRVLLPQYAETQLENDL